MFYKKKKKKKDVSSGMVFVDSKGHEIVESSGKKFTPEQRKKYREAMKTKDRYRRAHAVIFQELLAYKNAGGKFDFAGKDRFAIMQDLTLLVSEKLGIISEETIERIYERILASIVLGGDVVLSEVEKVEAFERHKEIIAEARQEGDFKVARDANKDILEYFGIKENIQENHPKFSARFLDGEDSTEAQIRGTGAELISIVMKKQKQKQNAKDVIDVDEDDTEGVGTEEGNVE